MNINISKTAEEKIVENASVYNTEPMVRIYVEKVSCSAAAFGIAFDDKRDGDEVSETGRVTVLTDIEFLPQYANGLKIDYVMTPIEGFVISSLIPVKSGCGGCEGCGGFGHKK